MSNNEEEAQTEIQYYAVLDKFDGDITEDMSEEEKNNALVERLHIENDIVVKVEKFENGELISSEDVTEQFTGESNE